MNQTSRLVLILVLILGWHHASGQQRTFNLERLVREAGMIFSGRVVGVETGTKDRMNIFRTFYTFDIFERIYGVDTDTLTVKQYGGEADGKSFYPPGVPRFVLGEEVLVFLYPPSRIGLTSSVGKGQGKFSISSADSTARRVLWSNVGMKGLFRNLRHRSAVANQKWIEGGAPDTLAYDDVVQTIRNLVEVLKKKR